VKARGPVHVVVLVDGLGWTALEGRDFLADLLPVRQPVRTVLGYSSGAIPSILTGLLPEAHGRWNLLYRDPERSPFRWLAPLGGLADSVLDSRLGRRLLTEVGRRLLGLGPLFECVVRPGLLPWFDWAEKRNLYQAGGVDRTPSIFDHLDRAGVSWRSYSYHRLPDARIVEEACRDIAQGAASFYFLYLSELDGYLHRHVDDEGLVSARLDWYAGALRAVHRTARAADTTATMTVVSDHGMTPVRRTVDVLGHVERLGLSMPADYLAVYDSTMARFWLAREDVRPRLERHLQELPGGRLVDDPELERLGILFPDRRYGELVFLLEPGAIVERGSFNGPGWRPAGMHGYDPADPHSDALLLASTPPRSPVATLPDIHAHMRALVG
jgi:hypothetical protein